MEKQKIQAISHKEESISYKLAKTSDYYSFLTSLLKEFGMEKIPDFYDDKGEMLDASKETDTYSHFKTDEIEINEVIGSDSVFLIIRTNDREKLSKFMEENCTFSK